MILSKRTMRNLDHELRLVMATLTTAISHTGGPSSGCEMIVLCTYQRPSRGVDPGEPRGICTKTFANSTYPGPIFFPKKPLLSLLREHNLEGLPNCNVISCIIFSKSLTIIYTVSKNSWSTCFLHTARLSFIPCKS